MLDWDPVVLQIAHKTNSCIGAQVTKVESYAAVEQQFGADPQLLADGTSPMNPISLEPRDTLPLTSHSLAIRASKYSSAYMLL